MPCDDQRGNYIQWDNPLAIVMRALITSTIDQPGGGGYKDGELAENPIRISCGLCVAGSRLSILDLWQK